MSKLKVTDKDRELLDSAHAGLWFGTVQFVPRDVALQAIARARANEREACAVLCDDRRDFYDSAAREARGDSESVDAYEGRATAMHRVAAAIRARGED